MTFDAGSIDAKATVDKEPALRSLRELRAEADAWSKNPINVRVDLDTRRATAEYEAWRARMSAGARPIRSRIDLDTRSAEQSATRVSNAISNIPRETERASKRANTQFSLMRTAIEQLGPALVPLTGGLIGLSTAAVGFGLAGGAAFLDIKKQIKDGTVVGGQYLSLWNRLKQAAQSASAGSGAALFGAASTSVTTITTALPRLNGLLSTSERLLGQTVTHITSGLVGGLEAFTPLIEKAMGYVEELAAAFDKWANGPGGEKFAATLGDELDRIVPLLRNLAVLASHFLSGLTAPGNAAISLLTTFSGILARVPVSVLKAATTAYIAFRTAVTVTTGLTAARDAILGLAAAENVEAAAAARAAAVNRAAGTAALAGGAAGAAGALGGAGAAAGGAALARLRAAGGSAEAAAASAAAASGLRAQAAGMAMVVSRAIPYVAAWAGIAYGLNAANKAMDGLNNTTSTTVGGIHDAVTGLSNLFTGNVGGFISHLAGPDLQRAKDLRETQQGTQNLINRSGGMGTTAGLNAQNFGIPTSSTGILALQQQGRSSLNGVDIQRQIAAAQADADRLGRAVEKSDKAHYDRTVDIYYASLEKLNKLKARYAPVIDQIQAGQATTRSTAAAYTNRVTQQNTSALSAGLTNNRSLSSSNAFLSDYIKNVTKAQQIEQQWTATKNKSTVTILDGNKKIAVSTDAWGTAFRDSGNDAAKATGILLGHIHAVAADQAAIKQATADQNALTDAVTAASVKYHLTSAEVDVYAQALGITADQLGKGTISQKEFTAEIGIAAKTIADGDTSVQSWIAALTQFNSTADTLASRAQLMGAAMVSLQGDALGYQNSMVQAATANQQFVTDFKAMKKGILDTKTGMLDFHNAGAAPVLNDLQQLQTAAMNAATAVYQHEASMVGDKKAAKDAATVFRTDTRGELIKQAAQLGLTRGEAKKLADTYFKWPKNATTLIKQLGGDQVTATLKGILQDLDHMSGISVAPRVGVHDDATAQIRAIQLNLQALKDKTISISTYVQNVIEPTIDRSGHSNVSGHGEHSGPGATGGTVRDVYAYQRRFTTGGTVVGPGTPTSDSVPIYASRDEEIIRASQARRYRPLLKAINNGTQGFAAGGTVGEPGGFTGVDYSPPKVPKTAAQKAATAAANKAAAQAKKDAAAVAAWFKSIAPDVSALNRDIAKLDTNKEIVKFAHSSTNYIQQQTTAYLRTLWNLRDAKAVPSKLVKQFRADTTQLNKDLATRDAQAQHLKDWQAKFAADKTTKAQYGAQISQGFQGAFDIGTSGQGYAYGIKASLDTAVANTQKEATLIAKAKKMHLDGRLIAQFLSEGPQGMANLEAIVNAGQSYVTSINRDYGKLVTASNALGATAASDKYNATLAADTKKIAAYAASTAAAQHKVTTDTAHISKVLDRVEAALKSAEVAKRKKGK